MKSDQKPKPLCSTNGCRAKVFPAVAWVLLFAALVFAGLGTPAKAQLSTTEHLAKPGFWPTQIGRSAEEFVGPAVCAKCHAQIYAAQETAPMARTARRVGDADNDLPSHSFSLQQGIYKYEIATAGTHSIYTVSDGKLSLSAPLMWAFGAVQVGQSYLYLSEGRWHEARVSFFGSIGGLSFTPGRELASPRDLEEAMSRLVGNQELVGCFRCHASGVTSEYSVDTSHVSPGVTCEACHGPGGKHVDTMEAEILATGTVSGQTDDKLIFNPSRLGPADSIDFCGACHSTLWDVRLSGPTGKATVVFPAYRLQNSMCWSKADARLQCVACHDPHRPRDRQAQDYDQKCLACHASSTGGVNVADHPGRACPIGKTTCVSCHMPKIEVLELHYAVTDHKIRIVHPGDMSGVSTGSAH